jgi:hypothetical protein
MMDLLKLLVFMCFMGFLVSASMTHPFYVSITDMHYNAKESSIQIAQRLFWDDLEVALSRKYNVAVDIVAQKPDGKLDDLIQEYLLVHNEIYLNGKKQKIEYIGYEIEEDVAWFYMHIENAPKPSTVRIFNSVLTDYFPEQKNIGNFYLSDRPKSVITDKRKPDKTLKI